MLLSYRHFVYADIHFDQKKIIINLNKYNKKRKNAVCYLYTSFNSIIYFLYIF